MKIIKEYELYKNIQMTEETEYTHKDAIGTLIKTAIICSRRGAFRLEENAELYQYVSTLTGKEEPSQEEQVKALNGLIQYANIASQRPNALMMDEAPVIIKAIKFVASAVPTTTPQNVVNSPETVKMSDLPKEDAESADPADGNVISI